MYYENPKGYEYQLYPKKACVVDEYQLEVLPGAHILKYQNMILWNSFDNRLTNYQGITVLGPASLLFVYKESGIEVYVTSNPKHNLKLKIVGYASDLVEDMFIVPDKLTHCIKFWRKL